MGRWTARFKNSPTYTSWLVQAATPLRLLCLTPLVLRNFSKLELDVFYLLASTNLLFAIFQARLTDAFMKMLAGAYAGSSELGMWTGRQKDGTGEPDWPLFERCYRCLGLLLLLAAAPALLFSLGTAWFAVGKLTGFSYADVSLWGAVALGVAAAPVNLYFARPMIALSAVGRLAAMNRIRFGTEIATLVISIGAVLLGGRLLTLMTIQIAFCWIARALLIRSYPESVKALAQKPRWDPQIFQWAKTPLWRGTLGMLATVGTYRMAGVFLASTGTPGFASTFLLAQNLLNTAYRFAAAPLQSQMPRYSRMLALGRGLDIVHDSLLRIIFTVIALAAVVVILGLTVPTLLSLVESNIGFIDSKTWLLLGLLKCMHYFVTAFGMVHNITNQMRFYRRNLIAAAASLPFFFLGMIEGEYIYIILGLFLPSLVFLNILPVRHFLQLGGYGIRDAPSIIKKAGSEIIKKRLIKTNNT